MIRDILEAVGRGIARAARNPKWRVQSLERRAFFWRREGVRLQQKSREAGGKKAKKLLKRANKAFDRSVLLDEQAEKLAERYGINN